MGKYLYHVKLTIFENQDHSSFNTGIYYLTLVCHGSAITNKTIIKK